MRVMLALLFLLGVSSATVARGADAPLTADEILARARTAQGARPDNYRETVMGEGSLGSTVVTTYRSGKNVRVTRDRGTLHYESGTYNGEDWVQNDNGLTTLNPKDAGAEAPEHITTTVTHVTTPVDAWVIAKMNARAAGTRTYYDAATFLPVRFEQVGPTGSVVTTYDAFGTFGARTLAKNWTVSSAANSLQMHYTRAEYAQGAASDDDVRERGTLRELVEFPPDTRRVVLPVRVIGNDVYVRVNIGPRAVDFLLDTGASGIFIDAGVAKTLGLNLTNARSEVTAQRYTTYDSKIPELHVGGLVMRNIAVIVGPMPSFDVGGLRAVGLLGFDFLAQLGVTIDYANQTLTLVPANAYVPPTDPQTYPFTVRLGGGVPMVTVHVDGAVAERMMFDTGWQGDLGFFDYFTRRYPQAFHRDLGPQLMYGVGGAFSSERFQFQDVKIGPIHFEDFIGLRIPPSSYAYASDGVVGNNLLSKFTVDLDYTGGMVYLTPSSLTKKMMHPLAAH